MRKLPRAVTSLVLASVVLVAVPSAIARQAEQPEPQSAKIWVGRAAEIEDYMRTAKVIKITKVPVGVTSPRRAYLEPGGPIESIAFKPIAPGIYGGFWESYKAEIAAYEIDKLLGFDMVPPKVEKRVEGELGAAIMWATPTKSFKEFGGTGAPKPPAQYFAKFNRALIRAKMFDNLVGNIDPNLGNWLVDPAWNLILIDHSRALTDSKKLYHAMTHIDAGLWEKMQALTEEQLKAAVGKWIGGREIRALLERRKKMADEIDKLVKLHGADAVFVK